MNSVSQKERDQFLFTEKTASLNQLLQGTNFQDFCLKNSSFATFLNSESVSNSSSTFNDLESRQVFLTEETFNSDMKNLSSSEDSIFNTYIRISTQPESGLLDSIASGNSQNELFPWVSFSRDQSESVSDFREVMDLEADICCQNFKWELLENDIEVQTETKEICSQVAQPSTSELQIETNYADWILKEADLKAIKGKNTNFPKYSIRLIEDYFQSTVQEMFSGEELVKLSAIVRKVQRLKYSNTSRNVSLLSSFFKESSGEGQKTEETLSGQLSRKVMSTILKQKSMKEIIKNKRILCKKTLLLASKVYALRCMNPKLLQRLESA